MAMGWLGSGLHGVRRLWAGVRWVGRGVRRVLMVVLPIYIVGVVGAAFVWDVHAGIWVSFFIVMGLAIYVPVRLFVTGRWVELLLLGLGLGQGFFEGASHGRHHGHR